MATSNSQFVRLCQVGAKAPVEAALAGGQLVIFLGESNDYRSTRVPGKLGVCQKLKCYQILDFVVLGAYYSGLLVGQFNIMFEYWERWVMELGRIHKHCIFLLQFFKLQVNCQDGDGNTGLMLAICYKKQPLVDILLAR